MKNWITNSGRRMVLFVFLLMLLATFLLVITNVGVAQDDAGSSLIVGRNDEVLQSDLPDLVVTDPDVDLTSLIREEINITTALDSVLVPAAAFSSDGYALSTYFFPFSGGYIYSTDNSGSLCAMAPVYLPDGVTVTAVSGYVYDNDVNANISLTLYAETYTSTGGDPTMASVSSPANNTSLQVITDTTISNAVVDLGTYAYYAATCLGYGASGSNNRLYAVQVFYTP